MTEARGFCGEAAALPEGNRSDSLSNEEVVMQAWLLHIKRTPTDQAMGQIKQKGMRVMAAVKLLGMVAVALIPGGLVLLGAYFFARAVIHHWQLDKELHGEANMMRALEAVKLQTVVAQVRSAF
jgi:hypothetical protein